MDTGNKFCGLRKAAEPSHILSAEAGGSRVHRTLQFIKFSHAFWFSGSFQIVRGPQGRDSDRQESMVSRNHSKAWKPALLVMLIVFGGLETGQDSVGTVAP